MKARKERKRCCGNVNGRGKEREGRVERESERARERGWEGEAVGGAGRRDSKDFALSYNGRGKISSSLRRPIFGLRDPPDAHRLV
jgi:hypothetical protein